MSVGIPFITVTVHETPVRLWSFHVWPYYEEGDFLSAFPLCRAGLSENLRIKSYTLRRASFAYLSKSEKLSVEGNVSGEVLKISNQPYFNLMRVLKTTFSKFQNLVKFCVLQDFRKVLSRQEYFMLSLPRHNMASAAATLHVRNALFLRRIADGPPRGCGGWGVAAGARRDPRRDTVYLNVVYRSLSSHFSKQTQLNLFNVFPRKRISLGERGELCSIVDFDSTIIPLFPKDFSNARGNSQIA